MMKKHWLFSLMMFTCFMMAGVLLLRQPGSVFANAPVPDPNMPDNGQGIFSSSGILPCRCNTSAITSKEVAVSDANSALRIMTDEPYRLAISA